MDYDEINAAVQSVWESVPTDNELRALTPHAFWGMINGRGMSVEDLDEAWYLFQERRVRVTAEGGWNE